MRQLPDFKSFVRSFRFPVSVLTGRPSGNDEEFSILFGGAISERTYLAQRAFDGSPREARAGKRWLPGFSRLAGQYDCDIEVVAAAKGDTCSKLLSAYFAIPAWVSGHVELSNEAFRSGNTRSRRRDLRLIERHGFHFEVTGNATDLCKFYDDMYRPTMMASHGVGALLMAREDMLGRGQQGKCELVKIFHNGTFVAGSLIIYDQEGPRLWSEGILQGDGRLLRIGVTACIYFFSFQHLLDHGYRRVNIGRSRAFLNDGALSYKRRFGLELDGCSTGRFFIRVRRLSEPVVDFLSANPVLVSAGEKVDVAMFVRSEDLDDGLDWQRVYKTHLLPGVSRLRVYALGGDFREDKLEIPSRIADRIEVRPLPSPYSPDERRTS